MSDDSADDLMHILRERGGHYVVGARGQPVAVLLTLEEYEHYLDLLDDEADSEDEDLVARLGQAAAQPTGGERQSIQDYLRRRQQPHA
jgi:PHD/YefM family antitoxin component YafN of YafNO toxin-antitoxin module